jgi:hypothetical protein
VYGARTLRRAIQKNLETQLVFHLFEDKLREGRTVVVDGLIEPSPGAGSGPLFPAETVRRLRCIMRLRRDLGVNLAGVAVILEMRKRIENLQKELELMRRRS